MDPHQRRYVDLPLGGRAALLGIPGGGKTSTVIRRVLALVDRGELASPRDALVLSFTKRAASDFVHRGNSLRPGAFAEGIEGSHGNVSTLHALAMRVLTKISGSRPDLTTCVRDLCCALKHRPNKTRKALPPAKLVVVDEAQDLSNVQYSAVVLLAKVLGHTNVEMVGDPCQNIMRFQHSTDRHLREHCSDTPPGRQVELINNYRSTAPIVRFANYLRPDRSATPMVSGSSEDGPKPVVFRGDREAVVADLVARVRAAIAAGTPPEDICVLGPIRQCRQHNPAKCPREYLGIKGAGLSLAANALTDAGVPIRVHFALGSDDDFGSVGQAEPGHVNLVTGYSSKGLEWPVVFVMNFEYAAQIGFPDADKESELNCLFYVQATRARRSLTLYLLSSSTFDYLRKEEVARALPRCMGPPLPKGLCTLEGDWTTQATYAPSSPTQQASPPLKETSSVVDVVKAIQNDPHALHKVAKALKVKVKEVDRVDQPAANAAVIGRDHLETVYGRAAEAMAYRALDPDRPLAPPDVKPTHDPQLCLRDLTWWEARTQNPAADPAGTYWNDALFKHQLENEGRFLTARPHDDAMGELRKLSPSIREHALRVANGSFEIEKPLEHPELKIKGSADVLVDGGKKIIDLKFVKDIGFSHALQLVLYDVCHGAHPGGERELVLANLRTGVTHRVTYEADGLPVLREQIARLRLSPKKKA